MPTGHVRLRMASRCKMPGAARRVPALSKGLLEPERVLKMAQGIKARKRLNCVCLFFAECRLTLEQVFIGVR